MRSDKPFGYARGMGTPFALTFGSTSVTFFARIGATSWVGRDGGDDSFTAIAIDDGGTVGQICEHVREVFDIGGRAFVVAKNGAVIDVDSGRTVIEVPGDEVFPVGDRFVANMRASGTKSKCSFFELPAGRLVAELVLSTGEHAFTSNESNLFVVPSGSSSIAKVSKVDGRSSQVIIADHELEGLCAACTADGRLMVTARGAGGDRAWVILVIDAETEKVQRVVRLPEDEEPFDLARCGDAMVLRSGDSLYSVDSFAGTLSRITARVGGGEIFCAGSTSPAPHFGVFDHEGAVLSSILLFAGAKQPLVRFTPARAHDVRPYLVGSDLVLDEGDRLTVVPLGGLTSRTDGELAARAIPVTLEEPELSTATVIDNSGNLLRIKTKTKPLIELRTGPLGLAKGDLVEIATTDGQVVELRVSGKQPRRLVGAGGSLEPFATEVTIGRAAPFEPRAPLPLPEVPEILRRLVDLEVASADALRPSALRAIVSDLFGIGARTAKSGQLAATLLALASTQTFGERARYLAFERDRLSRLGDDLAAILPKGANVSFRFNPEDELGGEPGGELVVSLRGKKRASSVADATAPGALHRPIADALAEAGVDGALIEVAADEDGVELVWLDEHAAKILREEGFLR